MSILSSIGRLFKKLWDAIRKILAIILIIIAVILIVWAAIFSGGAALVLFGFAISQTAAFVLAALALTGAFLIDAETSKEVVGKIGEAMGDAAESVGGVVGEVVGGGVSGILGSTGGMLLIGGIALYFLLSSSSDAPGKSAKTDKPVAKSDKRVDRGTLKDRTTPGKTRVANPKEVRNEYGSIPLLA